MPRLFAPNGIEAAASPLAAADFLRSAAAGRTGYFISHLSLCKRSIALIYPLMEHNSLKN